MSRLRPEPRRPLERDHAEEVARIVLYRWAPVILWLGSAAVVAALVVVLSS